jgi:hypothetical protein
LQDPKKFSQYRNFWFKICHLATLIEGRLAKLQKAESNAAAISEAPPLVLQQPDVHYAQSGTISVWKNTL